MTRRAAKGDLVSKAKEMLARKDVGPEELLAMAGQLRGCQSFDFARRLLAKARQDKIDDPALRTKIDQQCALCTYKDPDLAAPGRLDDALAILNSALEDAETFRRLPVAKHGSARAIRERQETFGIAGAIYKNKWQTEVQPGYLLRSLDLYDRGYALGPENDQGYTGINAAFVLDLLAEQEAKYSETNEVVRNGIAERRARASAIRQHIRDTLVPLCQRSPDDGTRWWQFLTLAEACFGLHEVQSARGWLYEAKRCANELRGTEEMIQPWQLQTAVRQLAEVLRLHEKDPRSAAWAALEEFVGQPAPAGVRTPFAGKVGLALSGGGFRASLFHIGVLARLAELDMLRHVEVLSCVSGGAIIGAHYYLALRNLLEVKPDREVTRQDYIKVVRRLEREFLDAVQRNPRMRAFTDPRRLPRLLRRGRTVRMAEVLESELYAKVAGASGDDTVILSGLYIHPDGHEDFNPKYDNWHRQSKVPILLLNATALNTGHNWQFSASWMGESPASIDTDVDGNERLRRMYYDQAPPPHDRMRLGLAVAASACVPGLFRPVRLRGLYPGRTVELVDGGVHDNQGVGGLLEQECTTLLVSDASGQMTSQCTPGADLLRTLTRSNGILQVRVREAEHRELQARLRSGAIRGLMFLHLKKDLAVETVDWVRCDDPKEASAEGGVPIDAKSLTSYGVRADVQNLLSGIRTDLDAFSDAEAFGLMASGYRMVTHAFGQCITDFANLTQPGEQWRFLTVDPFICDGDVMGGVRPALRIGAHRFLKAFRFERWWPWIGRAGTAFPVMVVFVVGFALFRWLWGWRAILPFAALAAAWPAIAVLHRLSTALDRRFLRSGALATLRREQPFDLEPCPGKRLRAVRVADLVELPTAIDQLGLARDRPAIVLVGSAGRLEAADRACAGAIVKDALVRVAREMDATLLDGATDSGIMQLAGEARAANPAFPLVGVAAIGTVSFPGNGNANSDAVALQPDHTGAILVPGQSWGDESPWLARAASVIAAERPSLTVLLNGGPASLRDVKESLALGRRVLAVRGTGRLADRLARRDDDPEMAAIWRSPLLHVTQSADPREVAVEIRRLLGGDEPVSVRTPAPPGDRPARRSSDDAELRT